MAGESRGLARRLGWLWVIIAVQVLVIGVIAVAGLTRGETEAGYRLRAETLLPAQLSVRPDEVECPDRRPTSPIDFVAAGALADTLPLYDGDLITVRILVIPTGPVLDEIRFDAIWPSSVVADAQPVCVFVLDDEANPTRVERAIGDDGSTEFVVTNAPREVATELEIWLVADDPVDGATFRTTLLPELQGDNVVVDPLGGRVDIDRRPGSAPALDMVASVVDEVEGRFSVTATVSNATARSRALDVQLRLVAPGSPTWSVDEALLPADMCRDGASLECTIGDLADGETVDVTATFTVEDDWEPAAVVCESPPGDAGFGLCVEGGALSLALGPEDAATRSSFVSLPRDDDRVLTVRTDPDQVVVRAGRPASFDFTISTAGDDLSSVVIVGSDCPEVARVSSPLDDGDVFLEAGESWRYPCEFEIADAATFRIDVAAIDQSGNAVSATFEDSARVIDPLLSVRSLNRADRPTALVANVGTGTIRNVAILLPNCSAVSLTEGDPQVLDEGERVAFACDDEEGTLSGAVAYGTDELGLGVVADSASS